MRASCLSYASVFPDVLLITPSIKEDADIISYGARHLVTKIADQTFENCDYILGITIPNSVDTIGVRAFYN